MPDARSVRSPDDDDLALARDVVERELAMTPVLAAPQLGDGVVLKLETLLPTGSFKVRGGLVAASVAADDGTAVIAASAGNHGLGVAYGAARYGLPATVVVPVTASAKKVQALEQFDLTLVRHGDNYDAAERYALDMATADPNLRFVSPYNDPHTIAGQATIATELLAQVPDVSTVIVPIGGGGLISGVALGLAAAGRRDVRIVGVVAEASPAMRRAVEVGHPDPVTILPTLADGLAGNIEPASITVGIASAYVESIVGVTEDQIAAAIRFLAFEHGVVSEGSGAVGVAALQSGRVAAGLLDGRTALLITGRNIAAATLSKILTP
ncbi:MAG TPA: pyridoxal-phosphate dependent enzyme [Acidimicrobiales bacterium]